MKQISAVEWLAERLTETPYIDNFWKHVEQAIEMEKEQLFLAANTSAKKAYKAGQSSMYCGCYEYDVRTTYEEWLYETFKSE